MFALISLLALVIPCLSNPATPDRIVLKDGRTVECRILMENDVKIVYRDERKQREVARGEVRDVESIERSLAEFLDAAEKVESKSVEQQAQLALRAQSFGLGHEARNAWLRVLALDPSNAAAWAALGGESEKPSKWLRWDGERFDLQALRTRGAEPKHPLTLRTAHFSIESDLPLERALDCAIAAERTYRAFYSTMGPILDLYVFDEVPVIEVHRDFKRMPAPPLPGMQSWFSPIGNTLYIREVPTADTRVILADMTDVMLFNSFCRSGDTVRTGMIQGWTRAGLGQCFGTSLQSDPAHVSFDFARPWLPHFKVQATFAKQMTLERMLRAGHGEFYSGPEQARYEAAAYTLFHFLAFADGGARAHSLALYLEDVYLGRGGPTRFEEIMGTKIADLEREWTAYVRRTAGA